MKILIVGMAKSGTSGLYYKIRNSLTGNISAHFECHLAPELPQPEPDHVLAKVIFRPDSGFLDSYRDYDRKISIVRDPRDRYVSSFLYGSGYQCPYADDEAKVQQVVALMQRKEAGESISLLSIRNLHAKLSGRPVRDPALGEPGFAEVDLAMMAELKDFHVFSYESLVGGDFADLAHYLGLALAGGAEVDTTHQRVVRTKASGSWRSWFTAEDVEYLRPGFDPVISQLGWDQSWELSAPSAIPAAHGSGYFMRLVEECRADNAEKRQVRNAPDWADEKAKTLARLMRPDWKKK